MAGPFNMSLITCKHKLRAIALLSISFILATPLFGSSIFVSAGLHRGECYAEMAASTHTSPDSARHAKTQAKTSLLNVFLHLSGTFVSDDPVSFPQAADGVLHAAIPGLPMWQLVFLIFHPPRAASPSR